LRTRIVVDWQADPKQLAQARPQAGHPPFVVIRARQDDQAHWAGFEPNQMILDYLLKQSTRNGH
jgi:hypothetical protein